ncbi:MAG: GntR family transcriptional regulator [Betaproteobacteria bacterium]|nr:GntR family transcriptional regulator [Betaproteobacteria bacterium]
MRIESERTGADMAPDTAAAPARTPRYEEIYRQLVGDIRDGRYPVGGKLPPELELCATFGASRHTVREAVRRLTEQGLIARRAGAGTLVLRRTKSRGFTQQISALPDLLAYVKSAQLEVLEARDIKAGAQEAGLLRCRRGRAWHRLVALKHLREAAQAGRVRARVRAPQSSGAARGARPARRRCTTSSRSGSASGSSPSSRSCRRSRSRGKATALGVAPGYAGFVIARRYLAASGTVVLVTSTIFPFDRMRYSMSLKLA